MRDDDKQFWLEDRDDVLRRRLKSSSPKPVIEPYKAPIVTDHKLMEFMVVKVWPKLHRVGKKVHQQAQERQLSDRAKRLPKKTWVALGVAVLVLGVVGTVLSRQQADAPVDVTTEVLGQDTVKEPEFKTIAPLTKTEATTAVKYDPEKKVANFADQINGVNITVSQQQMPEDFKVNPTEKVQKLAEQFAANEKITAGDITAYIGTSVKGPQSVVTYKGDLLIFIFSQTKIDNKAWGEYISQLR